MSVKILISLSIFAIFLHTVQSLNCYLCLGPAKGGCASMNSNDLVKQKCNFRNFLEKLPETTRWELENEIDVSLKPSCVQAITTDKRTNVTAYDRSCIYVPQRWKACKFLQHFVNVKNCFECQTDYCNNKAMVE